MKDRREESGISGIETVDAITPEESKALFTEIRREAVRQTWGGHIKNPQNREALVTRFLALKSRILAAQKTASRAASTRESSEIQSIQGQMRVTDLHTYLTPAGSTSEGKLGKIAAAKQRGVEARAALPNFAGLVKDIDVFVNELQNYMYLTDTPNLSGLRQDN